MTQVAAAVSSPLPAGAAVRAAGGAGRQPWALLLLPAALYLGTLLLCGGRPAPDGYDGVGFALALDEFDLARFQPQPPGYPLLVVLGRLLRWAGLPPVAAIAAVNALLLGSGIAAAAALVRRLAGPAAGLLCALLLTLSPLCWALGTASLSDGAGLGAVLLAATVAAAGRPLAGGFLFGLALGLRPSYLPLALPLLLVLRRRVCWRTSARAAAAVLFGVLAWLVPLTAVVGPQPLWTLMLHHLHGHVYDFGGTVVSDPSVGGRLWALGLGLVQGGFGPAWPAGLLILAAACWARRSTGAARSLGLGLLLVLLVWGAWALVGQPVRGSGRHLLPAAVSLLMLVAVLAGGAGRAGRIAGAALALCLGLSSAKAVWALRSEPPAGAKLALFIDAHFPSGTPLYGARAARYLDWLRGPGAARPARFLGEVIVDLERRDHPPHQVLITSEVQASPESRGRLRTLGRFCPPAGVPPVIRFDREAQSAAVIDRDGADSCVELLSYQVWP